MQALVERIRTTLETERQCFVRPDELKRIWPAVDDEHREPLVRELAGQNGFRI